MFAKMDFQHTLLFWYQNHKRDLPWRNTTDAYIIWLSEIILQQTRVEQGTPYFLRFVEAFPTVADFANANEADILKLWQGLGYYSRARNMHATAKNVVDEYQGVFPTKYSELINLRGIGPYSAAAISSFSNGEPKAVLDGNVFRVFARYFGIDTPINSTKGIAEFTMLAEEMLFLPQPGLYNQAIMEFGALQCKPKNPDCATCPLSQSCVALRSEMVNKLPKKLPKAAKKHRFFNYFICQKNGNVLVKHRQAGDIWQHLYDFPCIETNEKPSQLDADFLTAVHSGFGKNVQIIIQASLKHILTHQLIHAQFFSLSNFSIDSGNFPHCEWVALTKLNELPQPKLIHIFIENFLQKAVN